MPKKPTSSSDAIAAWQTYLDALPPAMRAEFEKFNAQQIARQLESGDKSLEDMLPDLATHDASDVLQREFAPLVYVIPRYLPVGFTFLAGKPKVGKSWLAMQIVRATLCREREFGETVRAGRTLYMALEDNPRRFNDRMRKQQWPAAPGKVDLLFHEEFHHQIGSLESGGGQRLVRYLEKKKYKILVIDTVSRAFIKSDQQDAQKMTEALGPLQHAALRLDIAIIAIDHLRKGNGAGGEQNGIDDLFGSVAKSAVADTIWSLYRQQGKRGAKLDITGKDVETASLKMDFDKSVFRWQFVGDADDVEMTERRSEIIAALEDLTEADAPTIAKNIGQDIANTRKRLNDLANAGVVGSKNVRGAIIFFVQSKKPRVGG